MSTEQAKFKMVLHTPEIPGNTGSIGRTCVALQLELILIKPYGFDISEKSVRRAGLDYWKYVQLKEFDSWEDFIIKENPPLEKLFFLSKKGSQLYYDANFTSNSYLIFGAETTGLPQALFKKYPERFYNMPMFSEQIRSLNLANAATAVAYEALRKIAFNT